MSNTVKINTEVRELHVVSVGEQGPAGPPGVSGGGVAEYTAGEALGGHRGVKLGPSGEAFYASNADAASFAGFIGVTTGAASFGAQVSVQSAGLMTEGTWSWTPSAPVFLGVNGVMTQTPPAAPAFQLVVGFAVTATSIFISPRDRVVLS